ncbi:MAG: acetate/propionate family kinase [Gemmataceae bacterium]|nr:acetate/propionate family kinase [Gemmataceae bacterium]
MKVLVANLGSTSFKYRLYDMDGERLLARGGVERVGAAESKGFVEAGGPREEFAAPVKDHAVAVRLCLEQLARKGALEDASDLGAIGFKAVHARGVSGVQRVDEGVLSAMEAFNRVAPAHNPPYVAAMRLLAKELPQIPLVAAFETGFHQTVPQGNRYYAVPREWATEFGILRHGFHGASHRYIATRTAEVLGRQDLRIVSCHLGGSSSLCAVKDGKSVLNSLGMSPQTGLPHNNRVGDFDVFALPVVMERTGKSLDEVLDILAEKSGLLGLSGYNDIRDTQAAAGRGEANAILALDVFVASVRHWLGASLMALGGADAVVFTGGIGENSAVLRERICAGLEWFGIALDAGKNAAAKGEASFHAAASRVHLWTMPTNEELIVARQARDLLAGKGA